MDAQTVLSELSDKASIDQIESAEVRHFARSIAKRTPWPRGVEPYSFQETAIAFAAASRFRCLIGDAMGLGKTASAIGCLNLGTRLKSSLTPALVVTPASVVGVWQEELRTFGIGFDIVVIETGTEVPKKPRRNTVYVTSWSLLRSVQDHFKAMRIRTLILDESHTAKEVTAQCTRAAMRCARRAPYLIELSGTPAPNRVEELWTQLWMIDPETFQSPEGFSHIAKHVLPFYMIRRMKSEVMKELPAKTRNYRHIALSPAARKSYRQAEEHIHALIAQSLLLRLLKKASTLFKKARHKGVSAKRAAYWAVSKVNAQKPSIEDISRVAMVKLGHLRRTVGELKVPLAMGEIEAHFRERPREPLVVFAEHRKVIRALGKQLREKRVRWTKIDGSTPKRERTRRIAAFQSGQVPILLCSQAGYSGITLTRASRMLFVERWWVPSREEQAEDRIHRIGQTKDVEVTYLMASNTIDDHVSLLVDRKRETLRALLRGESVIEMTEKHVAVPHDLTRSIADKILSRMHFDVDEVEVTLPLLRAYLRRKLKR
jgi:SNF2 family DNA or RNA helicase